MSTAFFYATIQLTAQKAEFFSIKLIKETIHKQNPQLSGFCGIISEGIKSHVVRTMLGKILARNFVTPHSHLEQVAVWFLYLLILW